MNEPPYNLASNEDLKDLGLRIRGFRGRSTRDQIAREVGISPGTLYNLETGRTPNPSLTHVTDIAAVFQIPVGSLTARVVDDGLSEALRAARGEYGDDRVDTPSLATIDKSANRARHLLDTKHYRELACELERLVPARRSLMAINRQRASSTSRELESMISSVLRDLYKAVVQDAASRHQQVLREDGLSKGTT